jgi:hypothetical protein
MHATELLLKPINMLTKLGGFDLLRRYSVLNTKLTVIGPKHRPA